MFNCMFASPVLKSSRYMLDKVLNSNGSVDYHAVCTHCSNYLGPFQELECSVSCIKCKVEVDVSSRSSSSYFVMIDPPDVRADYISAHGDYYDHIVDSRKPNRNRITDVYDGRKYEEFLKKLNENDRKNYVTAVFNTDGTPVSKSSEYSVWPIYIMPNELPSQDRLNSLICVGL